MKKMHLLSRVPLPVTLIAFSFVGFAQGAVITNVTNPVVYSDGRPYPSYRMAATDLGKFLDYGGASNQTDYLGIREALINQVDGKFYLYYDGAGPNGWLAHLAESTDMENWVLKGPVLGFGAAGTPDSASAAAPWIIKDDAGLWHMFYLGTPNASPAPDYVPSPPYETLRASAASPAGPWTKHYTPQPFNITPGTYYSETASPGHVVKKGNQYLQFFSAAASQGVFKRTLGIARTTDLAGTWTVDPAPIVPLEEQIENSSLYYEPANSTWFLFTNHIGIEGGAEFTDGIWVYWTKDLNTWDAAHKAVVLDGSNCTWSGKCIGMPSVTVVGDKLYIFYDAPGGTSTSHMRRNLGMATLQLPLDPTLPPTAPIIVGNPSFEGAKSTGGWTPPAGTTPGPGLSTASVPSPWVGLTILSTSGLSTTFTHPRNEIPPSDLSGFYQWSQNLAQWYAGDGATGWPGGPSVMITAQPAGAITTVTATASEAMESLFLRAGVARN